MKGLRIIFMGTPEFATASLGKLIDVGYRVVGVVTAPDRPAGRGRKLQESDVKNYAVKQNIPVLQPTNLKNETFLSQLRELNANLQIVVAFRMLPKVVWEIPEFGTFNLHASLLPAYRGAAPINWAIINGETETGATTFFIDEKIDTGEIILQERMAILPDDTAGTLHDKLMLMGADLVVETVQQIEKGAVRTEKQDVPSEEKPAPKIHKKTCEIDWNASLETIHNNIRGLSPYPTAWTTLFNDKEKLLLKIYAASKEKTTHDLKTGTVKVEQKRLKIAAKDGFIELYEIQLPGKRRMQTQDLLNGFDIVKNAYVN